MGLLDKLWDDTVAGPTPDAGLGRLRRHHTFSSSMRSALQQEQEQAVRQHKARDEVDAMTVSRSITILRTSSFRSSADSGSPSLPSSPGSAPDSPFTPRTPRGGEWRKLRRKTTSDATAAEDFEPAQPRNPTVYDWVVISALDR